MELKATKFKKISYEVSNQSKFTFDIKPVLDFVLDQILKFKNDAKIINLFAGKNLLKNIARDYFNLIDNSDQEALAYLKSIESNSVDLIISDPPFAKHYFKLYNCNKMSEYNKWYWDVKKEMARILKVGGISIQTGYETNGIGIIKGFQKEKLLIVAHGGLLRDTFIYSEKKIFDGNYYKIWKDLKNGK